MNFSIESIAIISAAILACLTIFLTVFGLVVLRRSEMQSKNWFDILARQAEGFETAYQTHSAEIRELLDRQDFDFRYNTSRYRPPGSYSRELEAYSAANGIISRAEREFGTRLSWAAREMLIIPVIEALELDDDFSYSTVNSSIRDIVQTISNEAPSSDRRLRPRAVDVVHAFWMRFCNIPPFCNRKERDGRL